MFIIFPTFTRNILNIVIGQIYVIWKTLLQKFQRVEWLLTVTWRYLLHLKKTRECSDQNVMCSTKTNSIVQIIFLNVKDTSQVYLKSNLSCLNLSSKMFESLYINQTNFLVFVIFLITFLTPIRQSSLDVFCGIKHPLLLSDGLCFPSHICTSDTCVCLTSMPKKSKTKKKKTFF